MSRPKPSTPNLDPNPKPFRDGLWVSQTLGPKKFVGLPKSKALDLLEFTDKDCAERKETPDEQTHKHPLIPVVFSLGFGVQGLVLAWP